MKIKVNELLEIMNVLQQELQGFDEIDTGDMDYYWTMDSKDLYNPYKTPTPESMGELSFDWENLSRLRGNSEEEGGPTTHDLKSLGAILRSISDSETIAFS